jgi:hypothetical protein
MRRFRKQFDGNGPMAVSGNNSLVTTRVRRHRASAGLIRVEVEVPTPEDALAVRRFAQARRRTAGRTTTYDAPHQATATASEGLEALLAGLDDTRREIAMQFSQALTRAIDPDLVARARRVALNFAGAVGQRVCDTALQDDDGAQ